MPLTYDKKTDTHVCSVHGDVGDDTGWITCWQCGGDGEFDDYEDDPINFAPGESYETCSECRGKGGWVVCGVCNRDNPDVEW